MRDRLDPVDEALRLYELMTSAERVAFLAAVTTDPRLTPEEPRDVRRAPTADTRRGNEHE